MASHREGTEMRISDELPMDGYQTEVGKLLETLL